MAKPKGGRKDKDDAAYIVNTGDSGTDRRTNDSITHTKLDAIIDGVGGNPTGGDTIQDNDTATTSPVDVPAVAGGVITDILIENTNSSAATLQVSLDGGTNYFDMDKKSTLDGPINADITQIKIKASSGTCDYQYIINRRT